MDAATGTDLAGARLHERVEAAAGELSALPDGLILARMTTSLDAVLGYLAALATGRPIALLEPTLRPETLADLIDRFKPAVIAGWPHEGYTVRRGEPGPPPHPDLGVLLPTSGSTGSPKLVRLSTSAVVHNARSIAQALAIDSTDVAPTNLPLFYVLGLSVLNSHLLSGGTLIIEPNGLLSRTFWAAVDTYGATSLTAVPYQFEMLRRLRFDPADHPRLRALTQSGGRLRPELALDFADRMARAGGHLYVMYGQTEAAGRIAVLPPDRLRQKIGSVGLPVLGGSISISDHEIIYRSPSVMMGYGERAADLARGDELAGLLATGDLGHLDEEGFLFIDGRIKRIGKVFGTRVSLDDLERVAARPIAAVSGDDRIVVWAEGLDSASCQQLGRDLASRLNLHWTGFDVRGIDRLPLLTTGKIDYRALESLA